MIVAVGIALVTVPAVAGEATVEDARATRSANGTVRFDVTVRHTDEGWQHYANAFIVTAPDGTVLATRKLLHPHVDEQPFTRSLSGVAVPQGVGSVRIHAVDNVHGAGPPREVVLP